MALDGLVIHAIVHELQSCVGGRINKIHQPSEHDLIFHIRAQRNNIKLLLSAQPTYPRVHLTEDSFTNPMQAPMFCMLMRKHCENGIIESVAQVGMERILHIDIKQRDELGDTRFKRVVIEMMGRHSNLILLDPENNQILDGIQHVTPAISSHRIVMPGSTYVAPPDQEKSNPLNTTEEEFISLLAVNRNEKEEVDYSKQKSTTQLSASIRAHSAASGEDLAKQIMGNFSGISPLAAKEVVYRSETTEQPVSSIFINTMKDIRDHRYEPMIVESQGKTYFSVLSLSHLDGEPQTFTSISECLEAFYGNKAERDTVKQRVADLLKFLQNEKSKNHKKIEKLNKTLEKAQDADQFRILGELLTASLHQVKRGDSEIEVLNYYDPEQQMMVIPLNPQLSPSDNAQQYFKKYTKGKNSLTVVQEQITSTEQEIEYIISLQQQLNNASLSDIEEIREELIEQGYIRDRKKKQRKKKKKKGQPLLHCYTSTEGVPIYVGKNNTQNEFLTNRLASASDTWLHTKDIPGSHVVIKSTDFGDSTLEEAAFLSAYYSQAKESSQVPVDYTLIRHVRKPSGAKPGYVIYDHQKTLFVTPDEQRIQQLKLEIK
jgi:predicted ribosome quality control (RQC) complex YloA/Tae2 family protein